MTKERKKKKYPLPQRVVAALACFLFLFAGIATLIVGFNWIIGTILITACAGLCGPAAAETGGGMMEFFVSVIELLAEGLVTIFEGIGSIFSGFG